MKNSIQLSVAHKKQLEEEFDTTYQTISMALGYVFNSDKAKQIRKRAKEMLQEESDKIEDEVKSKE